jgi:hypothetical protein
VIAIVSRADGLLVGAECGPVAVEGELTGSMSGRDIGRQGHRLSRELVYVTRGGTAVAAFGQNPADNVISVFGFEYGYFLADQVLAGAGYWVNLEQAGTLSLTGASQ